MTDTLPDSGNQLAVARPHGQIAARTDSALVVPAIVADTGDGAAKRFLEYFTVTIRNRNTRLADLHAARQFFAWCERERIQLIDIEPLHRLCLTNATGMAPSSARSAGWREQCGIRSSDFIH
jgi:hypothetical protein